MTTPKWAITVTIPADRPLDRDRLFAAIADAAIGWEPENRDGWDIDVSAGPVAPCPHVVTGDEGTSHCTLAETTATEVDALRTRAERAESTVAVIRRRAVEHPKGLSAGYVLAAIDTPPYPEETPVTTVTTADLPSVLTLLEARTSTTQGAWASVIDTWGRDVSDTELLTMARDALRRALTEDTPDTQPEMDEDCSSCGEDMPKNECPRSQRPCGHHCNHSWSHDTCCWCGEDFHPGASTHTTTDTPTVVQCDECETTGQNCRAHKTTPAHCTCATWRNWAVATRCTPTTSLRWECPTHGPQAHLEETPDAG